MAGIGDIVDFVNRVKARNAAPAATDVTILPAEPERFPVRELEVCEPPFWNSTLDSVDDAHRVLPQIMLEYLSIPNPGYMLLVKALPGTGKTTAAVKIAETLAGSGKRVGYAGPRHDFYGQVLDKAEYPSYWYEWLPRRDGDDSHNWTCRYTGPITSWLNRGYDAMRFCQGVCGADFVKSICPYHGQKNVNLPIIFIQHQHVALAHPIEFDVLIGDESPMTAFMHEWSIPARYILPQGMQHEESLTHLLYYLTTIAENSEHMEGRELIDFLGGARAVIDACDTFVLPANSKIMQPPIWRPGDVEDAPYFHLPDTISLLRREAECYLKGIDYAHRIIIHGGEMKLLLRHPGNEKLPAHIIWLDATGNEQMYGQCFQRPVKTVDVQPHIRGKIFQVVDRANGKSTIIDHKTSNLRRHGDHLTLQIQNIIESNCYRKPAIISFQKFLEQSDIISKTGAASAHFYAARGSNDFENCDAIIVAGTPQPNIYDIAKTAKMIYFERDEAFRFRDFGTKTVKYRYRDADGRGRMYPISGFWSDPDLQEILSTFREDEIVQAAHRGRPVNRAVDIWLLLNMPIDGLPPDELLTIRDVMGTPAGVDTWSYKKALDMAEVIFSEKGIVTLADFIEKGISKPTAIKYFNCLTEKSGWAEAKIKTNKKGHPPRAIIKAE